MPAGKCEEEEHSASGMLRVFAESMESLLLVRERKEWFGLNELGIELLIAQAQYML